jgi:CheY-like chemotaxis protein
MNEATILCLDDEPVGLEIRATVLRYAGYIVFAASSAEEALRILADQHIDIVISDYLLKGTTGTQVAASMKEIRPDIPILILSGVTELPEGMESADCFLRKCEPPPVLLATVANLLAQRDAAKHDAATTRKAGGVVISSAQDRMEVWRGRNASPSNK